MSNLTLDIVVEDPVCPFSVGDLERVRAAGYGCEFYRADGSAVILRVPLETCDSEVIKLLRGGAHANIKRRRDLHG